MRIQILPCRKCVIIAARWGVVREECRRAMRGGVSLAVVPLVVDVDDDDDVGGGMSYFISLWRDSARGMV